MRTQCVPWTRQYGEPFWLKLDEAGGHTKDQPDGVIAASVWHQRIRVCFDPARHCVLE